MRLSVLDTSFAIPRKQTLPKRYWRSRLRLRIDIRCLAFAITENSAPVRWTFERMRQEFDALRSRSRFTGH